MKKSELKKILLGKKEASLKKKKELMENDSKYKELLEKDFERLKMALFASFSEKFYLQNNYYLDENDKIKVKYYCYYSEKYRNKGSYFTFEIHDVKNNSVFYVSEKDIEDLKENGDKILGNVKCKFSKIRCIDSTLKGEAVPIKFIITRGDFEKIIDNVFSSDAKGKSLKKEFKK